MYINTRTCMRVIISQHVHVYTHYSGLLVAGDVEHLKTLLVLFQVMIEPTHREHIQHGSSTYVVHAPLNVRT